MSIKKTVIMTVFISAIFVGASFMVAQAYDPLVRIPGLPAAGPVNLSQYVVGLYNFLLSIVGIVAVMMLIIGGMKYITAAGNASTIADAKDTISNAIFGLLLALLSWVIVSTINPDVLYIKHPASSLTGGYTADLGACGTYDPTAVAPAPNCICKEDVVPPVTFIGVADEDACNVACADDCNLSDPLPCIKGGSSEKPIMDEVGDWWCYCVDGEHVKLSAAAIAANAKCNEVCSTKTWADDGKYHGISHNVTIGNKLTAGEDGVFVSGGPLESNILGLKFVYFDLTEIRDCKNGIISKALDYDGGGPFLWAWTDESCCEQRLNACVGWGAVCSMVGIPPPPRLPSFGFMIPLCEDDTYIDKPPETLIYKHAYLLSGAKEVWFGITSDGDAGCQSDEFVIEIEVE